MPGHGHHSIPELPTLDPGMTLLDTNDPHGPLNALARRAKCPVPVTRTNDDAFSEVATQTIRCASTPMGPRFVGDAFETFGFPQDDDWVQTTLAL